MPALARRGSDSEMAPQDPQSLIAHRRFQLIWWLVMVLAGALYFVVIILTPAVDPRPNPILEWALLAMATYSVAISFSVKKRLRGPQGEMRDLIRERRALIGALVFCEGAAIYGVVLHFITGSTRPAHRRDWDRRSAAPLSQAGRLAL
jgi:hypothetical protein